MTPSPTKKNTPAAPKSPVRLAREAAYRTLVLEAAERVFAAKGYDGAKIKDVADEAGLALGTVYSLFPSKHEVFVAVHAFRGMPLLERVLGALTGHEAPFDALLRGAVVACDYYATHPAYLRMHLESGTSWASPRLDVDEERNVYAVGVAPLVPLFERARDRGELVDERPETCARLYLASLQVLLGEWVDEGLVTPSRDVAARIDRATRRSFARVSG